MPKLRVRARAVDMLGRQQIAGIPTAIHELFKNAHDAYAKHVVVDFIREDSLLVLRDDGYGMSPSEFETRWLTLGTESKIGANDWPNGFESIPSGMERRPIMGEKGIGRLAIAAVGPQVLILTRSGKSKPESDLVACLIHWGLFELTGIDLEQIDIPIVTVADGKLPDRVTLKGLANQIRENLESLGSAVSAKAKATILADLALADFDVPNIEKNLGGPTLANGASGTHFYVRPTNSILVADIEATAEESGSPLEKMLLGFSNTMMLDRPPAVLAEFRDHREDGVVDELIAGSSFFTPEEFRSADHHVEGRFDEFGQFLGTVAVYDQPAVQHQISWPEAAGRATECGPFRISFAYVQGSARDSRLPPDEWALISAKLNRIGGLYVYRDGIRILPYGNSDYDFLNIERRRTKSAQDWFFSYRRFMGAVEITNRENANLVEKAGREGFRANLAYRQMTAILENFFSRLAIDFFRPTSIYGTEFNEAKVALNRDAALLARREESSRRRRQELSEKLARFFESLESGLFSTTANSILQDVEQRLRAAADVKDADRIANLIIGIETSAKAKLKQLLDSSAIAKPRGLGLPKTLQADWNSYVKNREKLETEVFSPLSEKIFAAISASSSQSVVDKRRRLVASLESKRQDANVDSGRLRREVQERIASLSKNVDEALRSTVAKLSTEIDLTFSDLGRTNMNTLGDREIRLLQVDLEKRIDVSAEETNGVLGGLRDQLSSLTSAISSKETLDEVTGALESQVDSYREQLDSFVELAQVGMALGIVQHEFSNSVRGIRNAIRKLKPWAAGTPDLNVLYTDLKTGFEHLESYLGLFTPMSRRLNRAAVDLSGEEIRNYLDEVFGDRLSRHKIRVTATDAFLRKIVHGYASTFLPVFVNLVDNAIYWMTTELKGSRHILLDADGRGFIVANTGPGIDKRISDRIFEFGETTKPGGRGMGLYLSKQALQKEGYALTLMRDGQEYPVAFRVDSKQVVQALS